MQFEWDEEQQQLYTRAVRFGSEILSVDTQTREREGCFGRDDWQRCGEQGLLGLSVPARFGGLGLNALTTARVLEGFGKGCDDTGLVFCASAHLFACAMAIVEHGSEDLKARLLPKLCSGEWVGANAMTEAQAGSDAYALRTTCRREGNDFILNGTKTFVTNGPCADVFVVYATSDPRAGYLGISAFAVERDRAGLSTGKSYDKFCLRSAPTSAVYLEDCRIPADNLIGKEGQGAAVFSGSMAWERACLFAGYVGAMDRTLERTVEHARQRVQFRRPIGKQQAVSHRIANMKLRLEAARLLVYQACWQHDQQQDATLAISMAKLAVSEAAIQSGLDAVQLHGALGVVTEGGIERELRGALPATIFSGTSEIQRDLIASRLGL